MVHLNGSGRQRRECTPERAALRGGTAGEQGADKKNARQGRNSGVKHAKAHRRGLFDRVGKAEHFSKSENVGYGKNDEHDQNGPENVNPAGGKRIELLR